MKPGDKLYFVGRNGRANREVTVKTVGRRWAKLDITGWRLDMQCDHQFVYQGDYHIGRVWTSREDYETHVQRQHRWTMFADRVYRHLHPPEHLTLTDMDEIERRLGL